MTILLVPETQILGWLVSPSVVSSDGRVFSWSNPRHPGYPYPEIAGYLLSLLALEGDSTLDIRDRIARRLVGDHAHPATVILISTRSEAELADLVALSPAAGFLSKSELSADAIRGFLDGT